MKNKFIALALITLSIATTTVSCTTNDDLKDNVKAQNVETTKVAFTVNAENANSATGKIVDRNAAPLFVENLMVWANSQVVSGFQAVEKFTFDTTVGLPTGFSLNNVAIGGNKFGANSSPKESDKRLSIGTVSGTDVLATMKAHTPYIPTFSETDPNLVPVIVIKKTGNDAVALTMKTDHGRILAKFVQETPNADDYIVTVTPTVYGGFDVNTADGGPGNQTLAETVVTATTGFEWSNHNAMDGQKATFVIKIYDKLAGNVKGQLLNTITKEVAVKKSTTKLCTFTVHNTDVVTNIENGGIVLTFPTIGEEVINQ